MKMLDKQLAYRKESVELKNSSWFEFCEYKEQRLNLRHAAEVNDRFQE